jgi:transcriptional regulator with XRE-family HTH domain
MTVEERTRFGALLRRYPTAAGLSQEALAERAGLSRNLERGARSFPHGDTAQLLAAALQLAPDERAGLPAAAVPAVVPAAACRCPADHHRSRGAPQPAARTDERRAAEFSRPAETSSIRCDPPSRRLTNR